jgi:hypothetical protein
MPNPYTTVYMVTSGDYSSYVVHCAFQTRELAEKYIAAIRTDAHDTYEIEELELWDCVPLVAQRTAAAASS